MKFYSGRLNLEQENIFSGVQLAIKFGPCVHFNSGCKQPCKKLCIFNCKMEGSILIKHRKCFVRVSPRNILRQKRFNRWNKVLCIEQPADFAIQKIRTDV